MAFHDSQTSDQLIARHLPVQFKLVGEPREWYTRDPQRSKPLLYGSTQDDPKLSFKIAESEWSKGRSVSSLSPTGNLEITDNKTSSKSDLRQFVIAVTVKPCAGVVRRGEVGFFFRFVDAEIFFYM